MPFTHVLAGVAVADFAQALAWYERALGRPPDAQPMGGLAEWHLTEGGWLQVCDVQVFRDVLNVDIAHRAGSSSVALAVRSLPEHVAALKAGGIPIGPGRGAPGSVQTATVTDPDGNLVTFVENPTR